jgi:hypothetical protein
LPAEAHAFEAGILARDARGHFGELVAAVDQENPQGLVQGHRAQRVKVETGIGNFLGEIAHAVLRPAAVAAREPAQPELAVAEKSQPQAPGVLRHQQQVGGLLVELLHQRDANHRQQVYAGDRQAARDDRLQPVGKQVGVGQRGKKEAVVLPLAGIAPERHGRDVGRVAIVLLELAPDHGRAIATGRVRQGLEAIVLLYRVHHYVHRHAVELREEIPEGRQALVVVGVGAAFENAAASKIGDGSVVGRDRDEELVSHCLM